MSVFAPTRPSPAGRALRWRAVAVVAAAALVGVVPLSSASAQTPEPPTRLVVIDPADEPDTDPGDGTCSTANGACTLRAAMQEANALDGSEVVQLQTDSYTLTEGPLLVTGSVTITGRGRDETFVQAAAQPPTTGPGHRVIEVSGTGTELTLSALTLRHGYTSAAAGGGALGAAGGTLTRLDDVVVTDSVSATRGGGLASAGALTVERSVVASNSAEDGGGIYSAGDLTVDVSTVRDNAATGQGGGVFAASGTFTMTDSIVEANTARSAGGIRNVAAMTLDRVAVVSNTATGDGSDDGGGGLRHAIGATGSITSSTFSDNCAGARNNDGSCFGWARGGAIYNGGTLQISSSTLALNASGSATDRSGAAISMLGPGTPTTVVGSLLAGNSQGGVPGSCDEALSAGSTDNVEENDSCGLDDASNTAPAHLPLLPLDDNGGPTPTHALGEGSQALDGGGTGCPETDQRGQARPQDGNGDGSALCDAGALEQALPLTTFGLFGFEPMVSGTNSTVQIIPRLYDASAVGPDAPLQFQATVVGPQPEPYFRYQSGHGDTRTSEEWTFTPTATDGRGTALFPATPFTLAQQPELAGEDGLPLSYQVGFDDGDYRLELQLMDLSSGTPVPIGEPAAQLFTVDDYDACDATWDADREEGAALLFTDSDNWLDGEVPDQDDQVCLDGGDDLGTIVIEEDDALIFRGIHSDSEAELQVRGSLRVTSYLDLDETAVVLDGGTVEAPGAVALDSLLLGPDSTAVLTSPHYTGDYQAELGQVTLDGGTLELRGPAETYDPLWHSGTIAGHGSLEVNGSDGYLTGDGPMTLDAATLLLDTRLRWTGGDIAMTGLATIHTRRGYLEIDGAGDLVDGGDGGGQFINDGEVQKDDATGTTTFDVPVYQSEQGELRVRFGTLDLTKGIAAPGGVLDGAVRLQENATLALSGQTQPITTLAADVSLTAPGSRIIGPDGGDALSGLSAITGDLGLRPGYALAVAGDLVIASQPGDSFTGRLRLPQDAALTVPGTLTLGTPGALVLSAASTDAPALPAGADGDLYLSGGSVTAQAVDVIRGCIWGVGAITGDVETPCLGADPDGDGLLSIDGDLTMAGDDAYLGFGVLSADEHGKVVVSGVAAVDGMLEAYQDGATVLSQGDVLTLLDAASLTGSFDDQSDYLETDPAAVFEVDAAAGLVRVSIPDVTHPVWPQDAVLTPSQVTSSSARLSWPAATDNVGVVHYLVTVDEAAPIQLPGTATSVDLGRLIPETAYDVAVTAVDAAGNHADGPTHTVTTSAVTPPSGGDSGGGQVPDPAPTTPTPTVPTPTPTTPTPTTPTPTTPIPTTPVPTTPTAPVITDDEAVGEVPPGDTLSSGGDAPSTDNPVLTSVTTPQGGPVSVEERPLEPGEVVTAGYSLLGQAVVISAPDGTVEEPLALTFRLDPALLPPGESAQTVTVQRNGAVVDKPCAGDDAVPDPCLLSRSGEGGEVVLTVLTSRASTWTFVAPEAGGLAAACPSGSGEAGFDDVPATSVHAAAVDCLRALAITRGVDGSSYDPSGSVTRAQMASFMARLLVGAGYALPAAPADRFHDDDGGEHEASINALAEAGIVRGISPTAYEPGSPVSRAQMAALMQRAYALLGGTAGSDAPDAFSDDAGSVHERAIDQLAALGITTGVTADRFAPDLDVRRDQMASFLARLMSRLVAEGTVTL